MTDSTTELDELLKQLAEKLGSSTPSRPGSTPSQPSPSEGPSPSGEPGTGGVAPADDALKFRQMFAEEMMWWEMIPPLDAETRRRIDLIMQQLPEMLKSLRDQPYLSSEANRSVALTVGSGLGSEERILPAGVGLVNLYLAVEAAKEIIETVLESAGLRSERGEEMSADERELLAVIRLMQDDLIGEERVPALLVIAVVGLTGTAAGVAIGSSAKKAWDNLWD